MILKPNAPVVLIKLDLSVAFHNLYPSVLKLPTFGFSDASIHWFLPTPLVVVLPQSPLLALLESSGY